VTRRALFAVAFAPCALAGLAAAWVALIAACFVWLATGDGDQAERVLLNRYAFWLIDLPFKILKESV
jgi:hypothetical protein